MWVVALLAVSLCWLPGHQSLRIVQLSVPSLKFGGDNATMRCQYDLEGDSMYSVKWYRNDTEFYRYVPSMPEPKRVFSDVPGVVVDVARSDDTFVHLRSLTVRSSGQYRCEVSSEAPVFSTAAANSSLLVAAKPKSKPVITGFSSDHAWKAGDTLDLNCTSAKSHPAAELHWLVQGRTIQGDLLTPYPVEEDSEGLLTSRLGLRLHLRPTLLSSGAVKVVCQASVPRSFGKEMFGRYYAQIAGSLDKLFNRATSIQVGSGVSAVRPSSPLAAALLLLTCSAAALGPLAAA